MDTAIDIMYDEVENLTARYVGFVGQHSRFDLAILTTDHFFGKKIVHDLQSGRAIILSAEEAEQVEYLQSAFQVSEEEAKELALFLTTNL